jgi:hypothetical protein
MTQHISFITRVIRRTAHVFGEISYAQHRLDEIMLNPTGE